MSKALNTLLVLMGLFCLLIGFQNFSRVQGSDITKIKFDGAKDTLQAPSAESFIPVEPNENSQGCLTKPILLKAENFADTNKTVRTWLKADWGKETACEKPGFIGWSILNADDEFLFSVKDQDMMGFVFPVPGEYKIILTYTNLKGSGSLLKHNLEVLNMSEFKLHVE